MLVPGARKDDTRDEAIRLHNQLENALAMIDRMNGFSSVQVDLLRQARQYIIGAAHEIACFVGERERMK